MRKSAVVKVPVGAVIFGLGKLPETLLLLLEGRVRVQQSQRWRTFAVSQPKIGRGNSSVSVISPARM